MAAFIRDEYYELLWRTTRLGLAEAPPCTSVEASMLERACYSSRGFSSFRDMPLHQRLLCAASLLLANLLCNYAYVVADFVASNGQDRASLCDILKQVSLTFADIAATLTEEKKEYNVNDELYESVLRLTGYLRDLWKPMCESRRSGEGNA
ncbi:MAG: hypothetical protein RXQ79_02430 [Acidilobus sp.]